MRSALLITVLVAVCFISPSIAQIPNGGFEDWGSGNYPDPVNWITTNNIAASNGMLPTCERSSPGVAGDYCAKVTSRTGPDGIIVLGSMVTGNSELNRRGYPFNARPNALLGQWKYHIMPFDIGQLTITLSRWDATSHSRLVVGNASAWIMDSIADWMPFELHINYPLPNDPDTAVITLAASASPFAVVSGSTVQMDEIRFSDATGISDPDVFSGFKLFPSPTSGPLTVVGPYLPISYSIFDLMGRELLRLPDHCGSNSIDVSVLEPGNYLLQMQLPQGRIIVRRFIKN
ncbi:MAG: T9SS type A sorting domain-containing protein [Flavobacteriales bacterium]